MMPDPAILDASGRPVTSLGYQAIQDKGRRQAPRSEIHSEDAQLTSREKSKLDMTAQDLPRNFELAAWALRMHVAYVSRLSPHVATGNDALNRLLSARIAAWGKRTNFDIAQRHDLARAMTLFELANVFYGDAAFIKLEDGRVQGIPGSRIAKPSLSNQTQANTKKWDSVTRGGLILDPETGAMVEAAICRWDNDGAQLVFDHFEPAENLIFNGYFTDFDQSRGRSPMAAAINRCTDFMEALEYTNIKLKLHSLLGLAFGSDAAQSILPPSLDGTESTTTERPKYKVELSRGLMVLNLAQGDKVDTIESKTPSAEFIDYSELSIRLALLAFDIPYTFLNSQGASFSARIADSNQYEFLSEEKRIKNAAVLDEWLAWRLPMALATDPDLADAIAAAGLTPADAAAGVSWVGTSTPWMDKLKQLQGDQLGIGLSIESIQRVCRKRGINWRDVIDENAEVLAYAKAKGVPITIGQPGQATTEGNDNDEGPGNGNDRNGIPS